jgi:arginase family enzyme
MPAEVPKASVIVFPFDLFGAAGTGAGALLLADAVREILDENRRETRPTRCDAYRGLVKVRELAFGTPKAVAGWRLLGRQAARQPLKAGDRTVWLGGNHLSVLPVYEELGADEDSAKTLVIQFDAHLDVYQTRDVNPHPANGNFLLHADGTLPPVVNVGHRDLFLLQPEIRERFAAVHSAVQVATNPDKVAADLRRRAEKAARVWIDIDADVFDPSELPAVHTPLPFGLRGLHVLRLLDEVWDTENVIGLSISEFDPGRDVRDTGLNLLGWLIEWVLLRWYEG